MNPDLSHHTCPHCGHEINLAEIPKAKLASVLGSKGGLASGPSKARKPLPVSERHRPVLTMEEAAALVAKRWAKSKS